MGAELLLATSNHGKIKELRKLLCDVKDINLVERAILAIPEPAWSFEENALIKAQKHALHYQINVLAEDSGIIVPALSGTAEKIPGMNPPPDSVQFPGVITKRFHAARFSRVRPLHLQDIKEMNLDTHEETIANNQKLLELMQDLSGQRREAYYEAAMVLVNSRGQKVHATSGRWNGHIALAPMGEGGFGHDPIFEVRAGVTAAKISAEEKNELSHRGKATRAMITFISTHRELLF